MMQAYTEEQKKALIADCEMEIAHFKKVMAEWDLDPTSQAEYESHLIRQEIALAALTAEPVKTKLKYSSVLPKFIGETNEVESVHCWIHGDTPDYATNEEAYAEAQKMAGDLYTAPPAAAPAVPDGWKLVPVNAFPSQWAAGQKAFESAGMNKIDAVYKAMVAAAPEMENAK